METLIIIGLAVLLLSSAGYINWSGYLDIPDKADDLIPSEHGSAAIQLEVISGITRSGVTTATVTADVFESVGGVFDFLKQADTVTVAANPDELSTMFDEGSEIIVRVGCTGNPSGGLDYYDGWYYVVIGDGNPVYELSDNMLSQVSGDPHYKYRVTSTGVTTGHTCQFTSGTTNYWNIGKLPMWDRTDADTFDLYLRYLGTSLASITDGTTFVDTDGEITANATLASDDETISISWFADATNLGWGGSQLVVGQTGKLMVYKPVMIFSTAMTAIGSTKLQNDGWKSVADTTLYAEKAFYKPMDAIFPTKGSKGQFTIDIPIDATAAGASTEYLWKFWIIDFQYEPNVATGSVTTTVPTVYGGVTAYGLGAMIYATAYTTSSGAGATEVLRVYLTTAA